MEEFDIEKEESITSSQEELKRLEEEELQIKLKSKLEKKNTKKRTP